MTFFVFALCTCVKEAGYRGKSLFSVEEEEEDTNNKIDDEVSEVHGRRKGHI